MPRFDKSSNMLVDKSHTCSDYVCDTDSYKDVCAMLDSKRKTMNGLLSYARTVRSKATVHDIVRGCESELSLLNALQKTADTWYSVKTEGKHA